MPILNFQSMKARRTGSKNAFNYTFGFIALVVVASLGSTLAANINLNSGPVEFGQGVTQATACDSQITVTPYSTFINAPGNAGHFFTSVQLSGIDGSSDHCGGKSFKISAYGSSGLINLYTDTEGTSDQSDDTPHFYWQGTLPLGSNSLVATFSHNAGSSYGLAPAQNIEKITIETVPGSGTGTLYGLTGAGIPDSDGEADSANLYMLTINEGSDFTYELVGALKYNGEQIIHATGLSWDPVDSMFYFVSNDSDSLFKFDPTTATNGEINVYLVGHSNYTPYPDLAFDPTGQLWGWSEADDNLIKIDKTDASIEVFEKDIDTWSTGLASDLEGRIWLKTDTLYNLLIDSNAVTGNPQYGRNLPSYRANMLTVDSSGIFWTGARIAGSPNFTEIYKFDISGLSQGSDDIPYTFVGNVPGIRLSSIEFTN